MCSVWKERIQARPGASICSHHDFLSAYTMKEMSPATERLMLVKPLPHIQACFYQPGQGGIKPSMKNCKDCWSIKINGHPLNPNAKEFIPRRDLNMGNVQRRLILSGFGVPIEWFAEGTCGTRPAKTPRYSHSAEKPFMSRACGNSREVSGGPPPDGVPHDSTPQRVTAVTERDGEASQSQSVVSGRSNMSETPGEPAQSQKAAKCANIITSRHVCAGTLCGETVGTKRDVAGRQCVVPVVSPPLMTPCGLSVCPPADDSFSAGCAPSPPTHASDSDSSQHPAASHSCSGPVNARPDAEVNRLSEFSPAINGESTPRSVASPTASSPDASVDPANARPHGSPVRCRAERPSPKTIAVSERVDAAVSRPAAGREPSSPLSPESEACVPRRRRSSSTPSADDSQSGARWRQRSSSTQSSRESEYGDDSDWSTEDDSAADAGEDDASSVALLPCSSVDSVDDFICFAWDAASPAGLVPSASAESADDFICFSRDDASSSNGCASEDSDRPALAASVSQPPVLAAVGSDQVDSGISPGADASEDEAGLWADGSFSDDEGASDEGCEFDVDLWRKLSVSPMSLNYQRTPAPAVPDLCDACPRAPSHVCPTHQRIAEANRKLRLAPAAPPAGPRTSRVRFRSGEAMAEVHAAPEYDRAIGSDLLDLQRQRDRLRRWRQHVERAVAPALSAVLSEQHRARVLRQRPELLRS
ncbi:uncharacterized protein LOC119107537 [Pollicipes pollicipes]|uniref:uncharacterized protein LOC119107537 n=1 Tax=Pollicipes pollicipes TaxID=41117 RepID=UPI001884DB4A|nr:uncharacterized protein LOC119107537 [Pollicipes pollicipes]